MKVLVAAYQMEIRPFDMKKNLESITYVAKKCYKRKVNFLVLPEKCWSGPFYEEKYKNEVADFVKYHTAKLSKEYNMYIIAGSCVEIVRELGNKPHNVSYLFSPKGEIAGYYAKRHLFAGEKESGLEPGKKHKVFDTPFGKIGIQICRDILYPETTKIMGNMGAKIIFSPAFWSKFSKEYDNTLTKKYHVNDEIQTIKYVVPTRALENELIFVFANAAGKYKTPKSKDVLLGYTQICEPFFGPKEVYKDNYESLMVQTVDTSIVDAARKSWKIRRN